VEGGHVTVVNHGKRTVVKDKESGTVVSLSVPYGSVIIFSGLQGG